MQHQGSCYQPGGKAQEEEVLESPARAVAEERGLPHTEAVALGSQVLPKRPHWEEARRGLDGDLALLPTPSFAGA